MEVPASVAQYVPGPSVHNCKAGTVLARAADLTRETTNMCDELMDIRQLWAMAVDDEDEVVADDEEDLEDDDEDDEDEEDEEEVEEE